MPSNPKKARLDKKKMLKWLDGSLSEITLRVKVKGNTTYDRMFACGRKNTLGQIRAMIKRGDFD